MPEKIPGSDIPPSIDSPMIEQAVFFDRHPEAVSGDYLNNFRLHFPGWRETYWEPSMRDKPRQDADPHMARHQSEKYLHGTVGDFLRDIDTAIRESGIDVDALKKAADEALQHRITSPFGSAAWLEEIARDHELNAAVNASIVPVYRKLREMGYRHHDLVK